MPARFESESIEELIERIEKSDPAEIAGEILGLEAKITILEFEIKGMKITYKEVCDKLRGMVKG